MKIAIAALLFPLLLTGQVLIDSAQISDDVTRDSEWDAKAKVEAIWGVTIETGSTSFSGAYGDLTGAPTIPTVPTLVSAFTNDASYATTAQLFSGAYGDLTGAPTIPTVPTLVSAFTNDASYATTAQLFSGAYGDLTGAPTIPTVPTLVSAFTNDASYATTAQLFSGAYGDLTATPTTLSGYGIIDAVTLGSAQTISGDKIFTSVITIGDGADLYTGLGLRINSLTSDSVVYGAAAGSHEYYLPSSTGAFVLDVNIDTFAELDTVVADSSLLKMGYLEIIMQVPEGTDFVDFELKASATGYVGVIPNDADVTSFTIGGGTGAASARDGLRGRYTKVNSTLWRHTQKDSIIGTTPRISELRHNGTRWELYEADDLVYYTAATGTDGITNSDIYPWLITVWGLDPVAIINEWSIGTIALRPNDESIIYYFHSPAPQVFELGDTPEIWFTESGELNFGGDTRKNIYHQYPNYGATGIYNTLPASSRVGSVRVVITDADVLALCRGTNVQWSWLWWSPSTYENDGITFDGNLRPIWRIPSMRWINEIPTP